MREMIPSWYEEANCVNTDPEAFFADEIKDRETIIQAKRVCIQCRIADLCLKYAQDKNIDYGIWGGLTAKERSRTKSNQRRTTNER